MEEKNETSTVQGEPASAPEPTTGGEPPEAASEQGPEGNHPAAPEETLDVRSPQEEPAPEAPSDDTSAKEGGEGESTS